MAFKVVCLSEVGKIESTPPVRNGVFIVSTMFLAPKTECFCPCFLNGQVIHRFEGYAKGILPPRVHNLIRQLPTELQGDFRLDGCTKCGL